ncbi:YraN family protein [Nocardioides alcanivorans]|uniref:YraN family protein n=1 Tax=Nocardioides alcanivorans TaxID=2897352 RepID=UPI001F2454D6|nr:YraN family protein [Nocardioides alcanivorans]
MTRTQALGAYGETLAAQHLVKRGMVLLDHNWRCDAGEIDLVLRDARTLVFCEVKTRRTVSRGTPQEAVTATKVARMRRLAAQWMADHDVHVPLVRLDLVAVLAPHSGAVEIDHVVGIG